MIDILKAVFLFVAVWWTIINVGRIVHKEEVPSGNIVFQAIGITGFVYLQWLM